MTAHNKIKLTAATQAFFVELIKDMPNWGDDMAPLLNYGNTEKGYITALKKAGLAHSYKDEDTGVTFLSLLASPQNVEFLKGLGFNYYIEEKTFGPFTRQYMKLQTTPDPVQFE